MKTFIGLSRGKGQNKNEEYKNLNSIIKQNLIFNFNFNL